MTQSLLPELESSPTEKGDAEAASSGADTTPARSVDSTLRRPGRGRRIALLSVLAIFLVLTLATGGPAPWVRHSIASGTKFITDPFAGIPAQALQQKVAAGEEPAVNILIPGIDSRTPIPGPSQWRERTQYTGVIIIVQVSGNWKTASVMSVLRDLWVGIPGHGQGEINAAYSYGEPSLMIHAVESLTGIHIDHFAVANLESFVALTGEIDGVQVNLETPQRLAGKELGAGAQVLDGQRALVYTRGRFSLPNGDFDRIKHRQTWMYSTVSRVLTNGTLNNPTALYSFLKTAPRIVTMGKFFTLNQMQSLALETRHLRSSDTRFMTMSIVNTGTSTDGQSIITLDIDVDIPLLKAFTEDRVSTYLAKYPDAVELLPATVN